MGAGAGAGASAGGAAGAASGAAGAPHDGAHAAGAQQVGCGAQQEDRWQQDFWQQDRCWQQLLRGAQQVGCGAQQVGAGAAHVLQEDWQQDDFRQQLFAWTSEPLSARLTVATTTAANENSFRVMRFLLGVTSG